MFMYMPKYSLSCYTVKNVQKNDNKHIPIADGVVVLHASNSLSCDRRS